MTDEEYLRTATPALIRRMNAARVLQELRTRGPSSRADLARVTGLSKPTVNALVEDLVQVGFIGQVRDELVMTGRPGRPAVLYTFRADLGYVLGVDIGADKLVLVLADVDGTVVTSHRVAMRGASRSGPEAVLDQLSDAVDALLTAWHVGRDRLLAVVVGAPGVIAPDGRVTKVPQLRGWEDFALRDALEARFDCQLLLDREVHLSLVAEQWLGVARELRDAIYVQLGVGVGAGLLMGGEVYRGSDGAAGEIGLMSIGSPDIAVDGFGPFESATGGAGIALRAQAVAAKDAGARLLDLAGGDVDAVDAATVFAAATQGDPAASAIVADVIDTLARGLAALICALNPQTVIISGGISRSGEVLLEPLRQAIGPLVPFPPEIVASTVSDEAVALGAVRLAVETLDRTFFRDLEVLGPPA